MELVLLYLLRPRSHNPVLRMTGNHVPFGILGSNPSLGIFLVTTNFYKLVLLLISMHEQTIAAKIIADAKEYGDVESITVEVGDLGHLPAEEMKEVLEKLTDWKINIENKEAVITCDCGYTGEPKILQQLHDNNIYECPECSHSLPEILDGADIILKEVEVRE